MEFKGTQTEKNIQAAFAGESQARNRYTYFAEQAHKEGHQEVAELFERMATNELAHARIFFKLMSGGLGTSEANLIQASSGEGYEWQRMYPDFAAQARADGLDELALVFEKVAEIEHQHEETFMKTLAELTQVKATGTKPAPVQKTPAAVAAEPRYRCAFCGFTSVPHLDLCPVCEAIGAFEEI